MLKVTNLTTLILSTHCSSSYKNLYVIYIYIQKLMIYDYNNYYDNKDNVMKAMIYMF